MNANNFHTSNDLTHHTDALVQRYNNTLLLLYRLSLSSPILPWSNLDNLFLPRPHRPKLAKSGTFLGSKGWPLNFGAVAPLATRIQLALATCDRVSVASLEASVTDIIEDAAMREGGETPQLYHNFCHIVSLFVRVTRAHVENVHKPNGNWMRGDETGRRISRLVGEWLGDGLDLEEMFGLGGREVQMGVRDVLRRIGMLETLR